MGRQDLPMNFKKLSAIIRTLNKFWQLAEILQDC